MLWIRFVDGCVDCVGLAVWLSVVWITCNLWCVLLVVSQLGVELDLCTMQQVLYLYEWGFCFAFFFMESFDSLVIFVVVFCLLCNYLVLNLIFVQHCKLHIYYVRGLFFTIFFFFKCYRTTMWLTPLRARWCCAWCTTQATPTSTSLTYRADAFLSHWSALSTSAPRGPTKTPGSGQHCIDDDGGKNDGDDNEQWQWWWWYWASMPALRGPTVISGSG